MPQNHCILASTPTSPQKHTTLSRLTYALSSTYHTLSLPTTRLPTLHPPTLVNLAELLYNNLPPTDPPPILHPEVPITTLSDTHNMTPETPLTPLLLHAGDHSEDGTYAELAPQFSWLQSLPHPQKVIIPGNHDLLLDPTYHTHGLPEKVAELAAGPPPSALDWSGLTLLINSSTTVTIHGRKFRIFGSPRTPRHGTGGFTYLRREDIWTGLIPQDTDIIVTHGPMCGHLDRNTEGVHQGCVFYMRAVWRMEKKPRLIVHGHIHEGRGREELCWDVCQWFFDGVVAAERMEGVWGWVVGGWLLGALGVCWVGVWVGFLGCGRRRRARTTVVNVAVKGRGRVGMGRPRVVVI